MKYLLVNLIYLTFIFQSNAFAITVDDNRVVVLLAQTGNGKSKTGNVMLEQDEFHVGHGGDSVSIPQGCQIAGSIPTWLGTKLNIIDTQGSSDPEQLDFHIFQNAFECIKKKTNYLHALSFVMPASNPRYSRATAEMVKIVKGVFRYSESGQSTLCDNVALIVNRVPSVGWGYENENGFRETAAKLARDIQCQHIPTFFLGFDKDNLTKNGLKEYAYWLKTRQAISSNAILFATPKTETETKIYARKKYYRVETKHVPKQGLFPGYDENRHFCHDEKSMATRSRTVYVNSLGQVLHADNWSSWSRDQSQSEMREITAGDLRSLIVSAVSQGLDPADQGPENRAKLHCGFTPEFYDLSGEFFQ